MIPAPFRLPAIFILLIAVGFATGCTGNEDFSNPLDPQNLRTAGAPIGLELLPGDEQVTVSHGKTAVTKELSGYRIYRRFTGDVDSTFEFFGEILGENGARPATEFIDTENLKNDQFDEAQWSTSPLYLSHFLY